MPDYQHRAPTGDFVFSFSYGPTSVPWSEVLQDAIDRVASAQRDLDDLLAAAERDSKEELAAFLAVADERIAQYRYTGSFAS